MAQRVPRATTKVPNAMGFGVIGTGLWGRAHAEVYAASPYSRLVAVCDLDRSRAEEVAAQFGAKAYTDIRAFLANADVEAVGIATPDSMHREPAVLAANAWKSTMQRTPLFETAATIAATSP